jgi:hypothetical protein
MVRSYVILPSSHFNLKDRGLHWFGDVQTFSGDSSDLGLIGQNCCGDITSISHILSLAELGSLK